MFTNIVIIINKFHNFAAKQILRGIDFIILFHEKNRGTMAGTAVLLKVCMPRNKKWETALSKKQETRKQECCQWIKNNNAVNG
jgi:hypothetical protein